MTVSFFSIRRLAAGTLFFSAGMLLAACQSTGVPPSHLTRESVPLEYFHAELMRKQAGLNDLKSFVQTSVEANNRRQHFRQTLLVHQEDSLRIDTMNVFGQPLGVFIYNQRQPQGHTLLMYDPARNRIVLGGDVQEVLSRTLGMKLDFEYYIPVFYGGIPRLKFLKITQGALGGDAKTYQLKAVDRAAKARVDIALDAYTLLPMRISRTGDGQNRVDVSWEDYRRVGDRDVPHQITIEIPDRGEKLTLKYTDPVVNAGIADDLFQLSLPEPNVSLSRL